MKLFFITALICAISLESGSEIFKQIPFELLPKLFGVKSNLSGIKKFLTLRLVCKTFDEKIITTINNNVSLLQSFYNFIECKTVESILKQEASLLNRLPNLRTHLLMHPCEIYFYLFYQPFSFCKTDKEYEQLYENQRKKTFEHLELFAVMLEKYYCIPLHQARYGWFNHGIDAKITGRECTFSQIGFLFFDLNFFPPTEFWNEPYNTNTINPINVLASLSFNSFFKKALKYFLIKIPEYRKSQVINAIMKMPPPPKCFGINYRKYFQKNTKPLLEKRLKNDHKKKPSVIFKKLKAFFKKWNLLFCITGFIVIVYIL